MSKADLTQVRCVKDWQWCLSSGNPRHNTLATRTFSVLQGAEVTCITTRLGESSQKCRLPRTLYKTQGLRGIPLQITISPMTPEVFATTASELRLRLWRRSWEDPKNKKLTTDEVFGI